MPPLDPQPAPRREPTPAQSGGIVIATLLWEPNAESYTFSNMYDERWVEKLYRGFARNLRRPFRFICFTDRDRDFCEPIDQLRIKQDPPGYGACIEPYALNMPMILCGFDTVVTGNVDHLADYCMTAQKPAVPRDPFFPDKVCNGVALVPAGNRFVFDDFPGGNDMDWIRKLRTEGRFDVIDDVFPGEVVSYKGHAMDYGVGDARVVYFHGEMKPHELVSLVDWIPEHWR